MLAFSELPQELWRARVAAVVEGEARLREVRVGMHQANMAQLGHLFRIQVCAIFGGGRGSGVVLQFSVWGSNWGFGEVQLGWAWRRILSENLIL